MKEKVVKSPNLMNILGKDHENNWVALSTNYRKILAVGNNLSSVLKAAPQNEKVVMKVLPGLSYAPSSFLK